MGVHYVVARLRPLGRTIVLSNRLLDFPSVLWATAYAGMIYDDLKFKSRAEPQKKT